MQSRIMERQQPAVIRGTNKDRKVATTSAISLNAIASVFLVITIVYLFTQVIYQQQEIKSFRDELQKIVGKQGTTQQNSNLRQNFESAHIVGTGGKVRSSPAAGDVYKITSWKRQHISGNMTYDNNSGRLTVKIDGVYVVYSQLFYYDGNNTYTGFGVYVDNKKILKALYSIVGQYRPYHTHYISGVFKIKKGQNIWVGTRNTRRFYFNEFSSFFGAYMLHPLSE